MTKEELLKGLVTNIGDPDASGMYAQAGISQRTLDAYADSVLPQLASVDYTDDIAKAHANILKAMGGQLRHEVSERLKGIQPTTPPKDEKKEDTAQNDELKALLAEFKAQKQSIESLQAKLTEQDNAAKQAELKGSVIAKMREQGATNDYVLEVIMRGYKFDADKDVEQLVSENLGRYNQEFTKAYGNSGAYPRTSLGGGDGTQVNAQREAFKKKMQNKGKLPKND